jgi:glycosyltransferase involved in cell wall biosynthesis
MRICQITSVHPMRDERIFNRCTRGLANRGHDMVYIAPHAQSEIIDGIKVFPVTPRSGLPLRVLSAWEAFRIARRLDADIFHYHDPDLHPFMNILVSLGEKVVFDMHENYVGAQRHRRGGVFNKMMPAFAAYERYIVGRVHGVVYVSHGLANMFSGTDQRSCLVRNIINTNQMDGWTPPPRDDAPILIAAGRNLSHERQCEKMVQALPLIHEEFPEARVRFMGQFSHDYDELLPALAKELGVEDHVDMLGWVEWKDSFNELGKSSIGCVLYEDNENNRIGLPNRVFDYMFANLPLMVSDFPELRNMIEKTGAGVVVNSDDPANVAEAAKDMIRDKKKLEAYAQAGREAVFNEFSYENELKNLEAMYEDILRS